MTGCPKLEAKWLMVDECWYKTDDGWQMVVGLSWKFSDRIGGRSLRETGNDELIVFKQDNYATEIEIGCGF